MKTEKNMAYATFSLMYIDNMCQVNKTYMCVFVTTNKDINNSKTYTRNNNNNNTPNCIHNYKLHIKYAQTHFITHINTYTNKTNKYK